MPDTRIVSSTNVDPASDEPPAEPLPRPRRRFRRVVAQGVPPAVLFGLAIALWYAIHARMADRRKFLLPQPHVVFDRGFLDGDTRSDIFHALWNTTKEAAVGLLIAIMLGALFATLMSLATWVERAFFPWAIVLQTVPILAMVPLIRQWFGVEFRSRVIVCVLIALFPIITNTLFGLLSADESHHDLFTLHGAGWFTRMRKLQLPSALAAMFTGFRISAGLAVVGAIVGEFFFRRGDKGLGQLIENYQKSTAAEFPSLWATVVVACLLGLAVFLVFGWLQRIFTRE